MDKQLVAVSWLKENIDNPNMVVLDASIPVVTEDSETGTQAIINGARFMDLKIHFYTYKPICITLCLLLNNLK